jgi:hypothetical protein
VFEDKALGSSPASMAIGFPCGDLRDSLFKVLPSLILGTTRALSHAVP